MTKRTKIDPLRIVMRALRRGYEIFPDQPNQIYKIFEPEELDEGKPGIYMQYKDPKKLISSDTWYSADYITLDRIIKIAYSLSDQDLIVMAGSNGLNELRKER